jgi:hypothetical protein
MDYIRDSIVIGNSLKLWTGYAHLRLLAAEVTIRPGKRTSDCGITNDANEDCRSVLSALSASNGVKYSEFLRQVAQGKAE